MLNPQISGPQHATVPLEVDTKRWTLGSHGEGKVTLAANGGQKLTLKVVVEVQGAPANQKPRPSVPTPIPPSAVAAGPPPYIPVASTAPRAGPVHVTSRGSPAAGSTATLT